MKTTLCAAAVLSLVAATAAHAESEGNGDPFPFRVPSLTARLPSNAYAAETGSTAYPDVRGRPAWIAAADGPNAPFATGSEGAVQTANSLPRGALEGTVAYAQEQSVQRYVAQQQTAAARARIAGTVHFPGG